jgi:hypothetical protein
MKSKTIEDAIIIVAFVLSTFPNLRKETTKLREKKMPKRNHWMSELTPNGKKSQELRFYFFLLLEGSL